MSRFWLISVNMGYGHQRTAFPLKDFAFGKKIINANDYEGISEKDKRIWETTRRGYELISRFKRMPLLGDAAFRIFDSFQRILEFYPKRDLSGSSFQSNQIFSLIEKGWGRHLIEELKRNSLPLITTFFVPAFMAEHFGYPNKIYCVICDADMSRSWVPQNPSESKIKYFASTSRVAERLKLYGVKEENIFLTGYPLPLENIGKKKMEILKEDVGKRILNLDPKSNYRKYYEPLLKYYLGKIPRKSDHPLTLMFSVGGAGAQKEIGKKILKSLQRRIKKKEMRLIFSAGIKEEVKDYFEESIQKMELKNSKCVEIVFGRDIDEYFSRFNIALRKTDVLWTKPSELSFYSALGIPIVIAPSIGSQEEFNKRWLLKSGFGILQENPDYCHQWLFDWLEKGYLAESAMQGFVEGEKLGTLNIKNIFK